VLLASLCLSSAVCSISKAEVELAAAFGDSAVLQADMPVCIWGTATPGEQLEVQLGAKTKFCTASGAGKWSVEFPALSPSNKAIDFIVSASNRIELDDVLVGEVWICAGQSNMEWPLKNAASSATELKRAENAELRLLNLAGAARGGSGTYGPQQLKRLVPEQFCQGTWSRCTATSAKEFSAVSYFFGKALNQALDVPVGLISPAIGGTPAEAWVRRKALSEQPELAAMVDGNWLENSVLDQWCRERAYSSLAQALAAGITIPGDDLGPNHSFKPGFMWQAGIEPLVPLACRGVIWYQGESNAESPRRVAQHQQVFETLVSDWREQWNRPNLPVLFVQLPAMGRPNWPAFRQSQLDCHRSLRHTAMAVTIDLGHSTNVHPVEKRPVGDRLARLALGSTYHSPTQGPWSSPLATIARRGEQAVVAEFSHANDGLVSSDGKSIRHFELAGDDGKFVASEAVIDGEKVRISDAQVPSPCRVRYAWKPFPKPSVNLYNTAGLPASPFEMELTQADSK